MGSGSGLRRHSSQLALCSIQVGMDWLSSTRKNLRADLTKEYGDQFEGRSSSGGSESVRNGLPKLPLKFVRLPSKCLEIIGFHMVSLEWAIRCPELVVEFVDSVTGDGSDSRMKGLNITWESFNVTFGLREGSRKVSSLKVNSWKKYFRRVEGTNEVELEAIHNEEEGAVLQCLVAILNPGPWYRLSIHAANGVCLEMQALEKGVPHGLKGSELDWGDFLATNITAMLTSAADGNICYAGPHLAHMMAKARMLYRDELRKYGLTFPESREKFLSKSKRRISRRHRHAPYESEQSAVAPENVTAICDMDRRDTVFGNGEQAGISGFRVEKGRDGEQRGSLTHAVGHEVLPDISVMKPNEVVPPCAPRVEFAGLQKICSCYEDR